MEKLEEALRRLEQSVVRLETAMRRAADGAAVHLAAVKADYAALADTTETVAARLDAMIGRLDRVLEG